jgi:uncharacterized protein involved in outer membrane biogenesis
MAGSLLARRGIIYTGGALAGLLLLLAALVALLDAGYGRGPFLRYVAARSGRPIDVAGVLRLHLLTLHPSVFAERVTIGNPAWTPAGTFASIGRLSLQFERLGIHRWLGLESLTLESATLNLTRDAAGFANWQGQDPRIGPGGGLPLLRTVSIPGAHVILADDRRHLRFEGTVSITEPPRAGGPPPLKIAGQGELNGRPAKLEIDGEPLAAVRSTIPYRFTFAEESGGSQLTGNGVLPRPFDFLILDASFAAEGPDLRDLYFLTGVKLVNTGPYHASGKIARRGNRIDFVDLAATSGRSDVRGQVSIDSAGGRPRLAIELESQLLRTADLGAHAAGRESTAPRLLLSTVAFDPAGLRRDDTEAQIHAHRVEVGRIAVQELAATLNVDHGVLTVAPLAGRVLEGELTAHATVDATTDDPAERLDLKVADLHLGEFNPTGAAQPPAEGLLQVRVQLTGHGRSLHEVATRADGTLTAVLAHGAIRASLAEAAGLDLRAIGLFIERNMSETPVRCGVMSFRAEQGNLAAQTLVLDTDPMLITGEGGIRMQTEDIDLTLRGHSKRPRLFRLKTPLTVRGTLSHPAFTILPAHAAAQSAAAAALGVLLTPLASVLTFVDPGLAKDADCAALMTQAKTAAASF